MAGQAKKLRWSRAVVGGTHRSKRWKPSRLCRRNPRRLRRGGCQSRGESTRAPHLLDLEVAHVGRLVRDLRFRHRAPARHL